MKKFSLVLMVIWLLSACAPAVVATQTVTFDAQYVAHASSTYVSDEVIGKDVVVYMKSEDAGVNLLLPSFTVYSKWYTNVGGNAIEHNSKLAVPSDEVKLMLTEEVTLPYGGVATPMPTSTPVPAGTIVFHDSYKADDGQAIYIDGFYNHCTKSFGYGLPEQGGEFNQWYSIEDGKAVKHEGKISLQADGYEYNDVGWSFPIK